MRVALDFETHSYLADWFYELGEDTPLFKLPTVGFVAGKTQFINGRHRTAVLLQYLECFPIAFAHPDKVASPLDAENAQGFLRLLALRPLDINEPIELPDHPIVDGLP